MDYKKLYNEALEHFKAFKEKYYTRNTYFGDVIFDKTGEMQKDFESIFPKKESEDERIRKELLSFIESVQHSYLCATDRREKWIAYLEKQKSKDDEEGYLDGIKRDWFERGKKEVLTVPELYGLEKQKEQKPIDYEAELKKCKDNPLYFFDKYMTVKIKQKPVEWSEDFDKEVENIHKRYPEVSYAKLTRIAYHFSKWANSYKGMEWSEEDEKMLEGTLMWLDDLEKQGEYVEKERLWLKSLHPQPKQEWRHYIWNINMRFDYSALVQYDDDQDFEIVMAGNRPKREVSGNYIFLKDICPQSHWKPSEEQMEALHKITSNPYDIPHRLNVIDHNGLIQLYNNLKKLM